MKLYRVRAIARPRQVAMYFCHTLLSLPYKRIAILFEREDHTTALSACTKIKSMMADPDFAESIDNIKKRICDE